MHLFSASCKYYIIHETIYNLNVEISVENGHKHPGLTNNFGNGHLTERLEGKRFCTPFW